MTILPNKKLWLSTLALMFCACNVFGFVPQPVSNHQMFHRVPRYDDKQLGGFHQAEATWNTHAALMRQRRSIASVQTQGLFGLGVPEIAIILIVGAFIVGPEKLGSMAGQFKGGLDDGIPDELKKIPEEFKKGVEEGETNARARNAKKMTPPPKEEKE
jgi:Sec-independent protein translocase protein TatA